MYDSFSLSTHKDIQNIVKNEAAYTSDTLDLHRGLIAAHKVIQELYPSVPMPRAIHHALLLAMDETTDLVRAELADGPGAS